MQAGATFSHAASNPTLMIGLDYIVPVSNALIPNANSLFCYMPFGENYRLNEQAWECTVVKQENDIAE